MSSIRHLCTQYATLSSFHNINLTIDLQHVYSNGHVRSPSSSCGKDHNFDFPQICASILGSEWSPVLTVSAVCITLQSMLASCKVRCLPTARCLSLSLFLHRGKRGKCIILCLHVPGSFGSCRPPDNDRYVSHAPADPRKVIGPLSPRILHGY